MGKWVSLPKFAAVFRLEWLQIVEFKLDFAFFGLEFFLRMGIMGLFWWAFWEAGGGDQLQGQLDRATFMSLLLSTQIFMLPCRGPERITQLVEAPVIQGQMALVLCRPMHPLLMNLARVLCQQARVLVLALLMWLGLHLIPALGLSLEPSLEWGLMLGLSLFLGLIIHFCTFTLMGLLSFWVGEVWSLLYVMGILGAFLSGQFFPLHIQGDLEFWSRFLPFRYVAYSPALIGSRHEGWGEILLQAIMALLCGWAVLHLYGRGLRKFEAAGG